jgi:ATP-dependent DNA helicase RecG
VGDEVFLSGTIKEDMFGVHMAGPAYERVREDKQTMHTARIVPMYPLTAGVTQKQMRFLVEQVLPLAEQVKEWIPESIIKVINSYHFLKLYTKFIFQKIMKNEY